MAAKTATALLKDEEATRDLAARIALLLRPGDTVLLEGQIGAGKSFFSRAIIQHLAQARIDVPSPTYTLVQTYALPAAEVWHADLYRLTDPDETVELGLVDAFEDSICLIEWPDRLGPYWPKDALLIEFEPAGEGRQIKATGSARWDAIMDVISDA